jgi:hypothetical protein
MKSRGQNPNSIGSVAICDERNQTGERAMNSGELYSEIKRDFDISLRSAREDIPWLRECIRSGTLMQELINIIKRTF